jgi:hypothetical protein
MIPSNVGMVFPVSTVHCLRFLWIFLFPLLAPSRDVVFMRLDPPLPNLSLFFWIGRSPFLSIDTEIVWMLRPPFPHVVPAPIWMSGAIPAL